MLSIVVKEMMMKVAEVGGVVAFFAVYFPVVVAYMAGGFGAMKKEMFASFGKAAA